MFHANYSTIYHLTHLSIKAHLHLNMFTEENKASVSSPMLTQSTTLSYESEKIGQSKQQSKGENVQLSLKLYLCQVSMGVNIRKFNIF